MASDKGTSELFGERVVALGNPLVADATVALESHHRGLWLYGRDGRLVAAVGTGDPGDLDGFSEPIRQGAALASIAGRPRGPASAARLEGAPTTDEAAASPVG